MGKAGNIVQEKAFRFAVRVVRLSRFLQKEQSEYVLSKQILRSGTSIVANIEEALAGQSRKDFAAKMAIASKETRETRYWLRLLKETDYLEPRLAISLEEDSDELIKLLTSIVKSSKEA